MQEGNCPQVQSQPGNSKKRRNRKKKQNPASAIVPRLNDIDKLNLNESIISNEQEIPTLAGEKDMKKMIPSPSKEHVHAEREARRLAKQQEKQKLLDKNRNLPENSDGQPLKRSLQKPNISNEPVDSVPAEISGDKTREQIMAERELKRQSKLAAKKRGKEPPFVSGEKTQVIGETAPCITSAAQISNISNKMEDLTMSLGIKSTAPTKAERRAKQEAQRAAKAKLLEEKTLAKSQQPSESSESQQQQQQQQKPSKLILKVKKSTATSSKLSAHRVKLFNHLYIENMPIDMKPNSMELHPAIVKLGAQYANRIIVGSNARCLSFMNAIRKVIQDYTTPPQKEFSRGIEERIQPAIGYLHQCRPLAVSVSNAAKFIKWQITQLPANESDAQLREKLLESIDTYIRDQIEKAAQAISISVQEKISNGDVILTFGCSSLITHILEEAQARKVDFRVVIVNARPDNEGLVMLERLVSKGIRCSYVLINAIGFIMPEVTKVLLGAHALLANGYVMARTGTSQVALVAKTYNVPVLVCCETHKFSERVQTDAFVYNELGNPSDIVTTFKSNSLGNWESLLQLTPLNLKYDITPPELVTAVVTEVAILPCTSVPVILRIKPSEIGY